MKKYLAVDYGLARIGVAVSYGTLAEPVTIVKNDSTTLEEIKKLLDEHSITDIVVGISEGSMGEQSALFAQQLKNTFRLPIHLADETLSSKKVHQKLAAKNRGKQQYKGPIDHMAAAEFLQEWLELQ